MGSRSRGLPTCGLPVCCRSGSYSSSSPTGRAPTRGWRRVGWALGTSGAISVLAFALTPDPELNNLVAFGIHVANPVAIGSHAVMSTITGLAGVTTGILSAITVLAIRGRFKRGTAEERQQIRWLAAVGTTAGVLLILMAFLALPLGTISTLPIFPVLLLLFVFSLAFGIPAACAVAILKYHLFDLDVVIKKAVVALTLTLLIGGTGLFLLAVSSQVLLWGVPNPVFTLVGGVGLGLMIVPFLRLCRRIATRITFGKRATPYEVLTAFGERVGETFSTDDVLPRMAHLLASATGATAARVLLRVGAELREEAAWPQGAPPDATGHMVQVQHQGEDLGALSVTMPPSDPMSPAKEKLIDDLASQAGLVLRNVKLIEELRASRQRLVAAQDEERRKIERDLHDGAQQQLVALSVQLKLARQFLDRDAGTAGAMLDALQDAAGDAIEDLRDLARGIYPPLLADQGLAAALEAQARKAAVPTRVECDALGRYPQNVESAVYFCTLEALNNVAKYANASAATVRLSHEDGSVSFEVSDDGVGFDAEALSYGTGLLGMRDRLDAIGGRFDVRSSPGSGTTISGTVPVGRGQR